MPAWLDLKEGSKTLTASFEFNLATLHSFRGCILRSRTVQIPLPPKLSYIPPHAGLTTTSLQAPTQHIFAHLAVYLILCEINVKPFFGIYAVHQYYITGDIILSLLYTVLCHL